MILKSLATAVAFAVAMGCFQTALADIGPKPTMSFVFSFPEKTLEISKGTLLQCGDEKCGDAKPLAALGPQGFGCESKSCSARAYGFARFSMLEVTLSDGRTLRSNVFASKAFNASFRATVDSAGLTVRPLK
jgi:uncharacterized low-complexity protein